MRGAKTSSRVVAAADTSTKWMETSIKVSRLGARPTKQSQPRRRPSRVNGGFSATNVLDAQCGQAVRCHRSDEHSGGKATATDRGCYSDWKRQEPPGLRPSIRKASTPANTAMVSAAVKNRSDKAEQLFKDLVARLGQATLG